MEYCLNALQDDADRRLLVAQLGKNDTNDSIMFVPPYYVRLSGAALERSNNVVDKAAPPPLAVSRANPEFKEQQEERSLRAVRPLALEMQHPGERLDVKNCLVRWRDHDKPVIASSG